MTIPEMNFINNYLEKLNVFHIMKDFENDLSFRSRIEYTQLKHFLIDNAQKYLKILNDQ